SLLCSLVVAVTLVPTLAARLLDHDRSGDGWVARLVRKGDAAFEALERAYVRVLRAVLGAGWLTVAAACVILLGAVRLSSSVQVELMPATDEGVVDLDFELPVGTPVERTRVVVHQLEERVKSVV